MGNGDSRLIVNKKILYKYVPLLHEIETLGVEAGLLDNPNVFELWNLGVEVGLIDNPFIFELNNLGVEIGVLDT